MRVITGSAGGRKLRTPENYDIRPTSDTVKESLFNILQFDIEGRKVLDGGVADSIPLKYFESIGYDRNVVILTQPEGYVKEHNRLMPLMRIALRKYPKMIEALDQRHIMYNRQLDDVRQAEREGRCIVIRPDGKLPIGHISHVPEEMQRVYDLGRDAGLRNIDRLKEFYQ